MPIESPLNSRSRSRGISVIRNRARQSDVESLGGSFSGGDSASESVLPALVR